MNLLGYAASTLVLATFCMRQMLALRLTAIASNLAFMAYGLLAGLDPVLLLHVMLLPLNAWRLAQERLHAGRGGGTGSCSGAAGAPVAGQGHAQHQSAGCPPGHHHPGNAT